jgi:hypothetical protein
MRAFSTRLCSRSRLALLLTAVLVFAGANAMAQIVPPTWDHYKVYYNSNPAAVNIPVLLTDQFGSHAMTATALDRFMNPVEKAIPGGPVSGITNPLLHYSWWKIWRNPGEGDNEWRVVVSNQFGDQTLRVFDHVGSVFSLLNPAVKNQPGTLPPSNHYKCYPCAWWDVQVPLPAILMTDQFGQWNATVMQPSWFCNPVEKQVGPDVHPIIQPAQHYVCYDFDPTDPRIFPAIFMDQFVPVMTPIELSNSNMICVPSIKQSAVGTDGGTWGKLKTLYR